MELRENGRVIAEARRLGYWPVYWSLLKPLTSGAQAMPASTIITPQMERVRQLADEARNSPEGVEVYLRVEKYGSLAACRTAARSLQTTFSNLRVRSRRLAQRLKGETTEYLASLTRGEYDDIACVMRPLPHDSGWKVAFVPGYALDMDLEVVDIATGKPLATEDPTQNRYIVLMGKWFKETADASKQHRPPLNPYTSQELKFMWDYNAEMCKEMFVPTLEENAKADAVDYGSVDLATLDESELEIVNDEGIE